MGFLSACEQNTFVPPPPRKSMSRCRLQAVLHALSGSDRQHAPRSRSVDLVARVQGFLQSINYKDGAFVKQGTTLFTIEPNLQAEAEQAQAAEAARRHRCDRPRRTSSASRIWCSGKPFPRPRWIIPPPTRDNAQANLLQAQVNTKIARSITAIPM
jgi:multidrug efflux pump subunit AcrA (membrane-fusion protein)